MATVCASFFTCEYKNEIFHTIDCEGIFGFGGLRAYNSQKLAFKLFLYALRLRLFEIFSFRKTLEKDEIQKKLLKAIENTFKKLKSVL